MGVVRAPSCGAGGKRRVRGCQGCQGGSGCPAGRPLLPFPPLLCNRALGSIKNSALQADCNAPSLGSTVWSGTERRRSVAFRLPQQRGPGEAGRGARGVPGPPEQHHAGLPKAVELRPCGQAQGSPGSCSVTGQGFSLRRCLSRLLPGPSPQAAFHWNKSKEKARLEGSEILHLAPEVALLYLYFFFFSSSSFLFDAVILGTEGSRKLAPAPVARSGAGRTALVLCCRASGPSLPPCRCLLFPQDPAKVLLGRAGPYGRPRVPGTVAWPGAGGCHTGAQRWLL